jgi:hypothetical protein
MLSWPTVAPAGRGQGTPAAAQGQQPRQIQTMTTLVLVELLAADKKSGAPIADLGEQDVLVRDNGKPVSISSFSRGADQKLRPVQLWFVLMCNEERHTRAGGRRRGSVESTEQWGVSFVAGRTEQLRRPLENLETGDTVGVAHWCEDGNSEIDAAASSDPGPALEAMERIAKRKAVIIDQESDRDTREEVVRLINNTAMTAFPAPFLTVVFVGGKQPGDAASKSGDVWTGSADFGLGGENDSSGGLAYAVAGGSYLDRLGAYLASLHRRYEIGFEPGKQRKRVHHIAVTLTREAKAKYPNAVLRYRDVYNDAEASDGADSANSALDWKKLDSKMRAAVSSRTELEDLKFQTKKTAGTSGGMEAFTVRIAGSDLTWEMMPNGDRRSVVMAVVASYSAKGQPIGVTVKELEIVQEFDRLKFLRDKPVVLSVKAEVSKSAAKVRILVRDVATGHIGTQDMQGGELQEAVKAGGQG